MWSDVVWLELISLALHVLQQNAYQLFSFTSSHKLCSDIFSNREYIVFHRIKPHMYHQITCSCSTDHYSSHFVTGIKMPNPGRPQWERRAYASPWSNLRSYQKAPSVCIQTVVTKQSFIACLAGVTKPVQVMIIWSHFLLNYFGFLFPSTCFICCCTVMNLDTAWSRRQSPIHSVWFGNVLNNMQMRKKLPLQLLPWEKSRKVPSKQSCVDFYSNWEKTTKVQVYTSSKRYLFN